MNKPKQIIIHKSSWKVWDKREDWKGVEDIREYHVKHNGWTDIGYHFVILKDGTIQEGRKPDVQGAHATSHNKDTLGICLIGEFLIEVPTDAQINSLKILILKLCKEYLIPNSVSIDNCTDMHHIFCHSDIRYNPDDPGYPGNRNCPGKNLHRLIPDICKTVRMMLIKGIK